jgi:hypothetical protein
MYAIAREVSLAIPWLTVLAISVMLAYAISFVVPGGATNTGAGQSTSMMTARHTGGEVSFSSSGVTSFGGSCWLPDPSGLQPCVSKTAAADR